VVIDDALVSRQNAVRAHAGTGGSYEVPNLIGLAWSAPYLHDSGVAVGADANAQLGVPGTLDAGIPPDPANSLRALVDRNLRAKVVSANKASPRKSTARVTCEGHAYWADAEAGVSGEEQADLVADLLSVNRLTEPASVARPYRPSIRAAGATHRPDCVSG